MSEAVPDATRAQSSSAESEQNTGLESFVTSEQTQNTSRIATAVGAILHGIPTLIVLGILGGIAWWGNHNGWRIPRFSEVSGNVEASGELWCDEHGVPEADCISCNADLMPRVELFGWCKEHGVHECVLDHPETSQLTEVPEITPEDFDRAARAIDARPRKENDPACKMHLRRIQFPSIEAVDAAGIDINLVDRGPVIETITANGEIVYDPTRVAHLSSRANGTIWRVEKNLGDRVRQGDVLAVVDAVEVGQLKSRLLQALIQLELNQKRFERISRLGEGVIPAKEIDEAKTAMVESEFGLDSSIQALSNLGLVINKDIVLGRSTADVQRELKFLGLPESLLASMDPVLGTANLIPIVAPRDGIVVARDAVAGEVIETDDPLFTIADASQMWLLLNIRLEEVERVSIGQKIVFKPDGSTQSASGNVTWISTDVDTQTRTVQVRGELPNPEGRLRNETFGAGQIVLREEDNAIVVSGDAIHWEGCCHIAFVRDKDYFNEGSFKVFHARSVRPGARMGDKVEVIAGLLPGEVVVTKGSGVLRAELLKGNLGAG